MSVKFVSVKCPECGANTQIEQNRDKFFCSYCGTQIIVKNENEHTYRHIDDAEVTRAETERMIYLKELEIEEKEKEREHKKRKNAYITALVLVIIGIITLPIGLFGVFIIIPGALIAEFTFITSLDSSKKKKARTVFSKDQVMISYAMNDYEEKNYNTVVGLYRSAGFENVESVPLRDLSIFSSRKNGQVEDVTINGNDDFDEGDVFFKTDSVTITYHSLK